MPNLQKRQSSAKSDVMTPERLRKHLFGGPQVPFWNYDPKQLTFGVEVEYFIAHTHADGSFTLATKAEYLAVIEHLKSDFAYQDRKLHDQPGRVSRDTERGFIAIKPDFAWHILEISFPPRGDLEDLRQLMEKVFFEVDTALRKVGLERLDRSSLPDVPEKMELVELDRLKAYADEIKKHGLPSKYANHLFPALITATHVHANISSEVDLKMLPRLYKHEPTAIKKFVRVQKFDGILETNLRAKFYENSFGKNYKLRTIPKSVPTSLNDYCDQYNNSPQLFPNSLFFPVRDMSYIRVTRFGTFEFRSSCSFLNPQDILSIVAFRRQQILRSFNVADTEAPVSELRSAT